MIDMTNTLKEQLINIRRTLHSIPEIGLKEYKTSEFIIKELEKLGLEIKTNIHQTGIVALLKGKYPGKTILFRCDMDGLNIFEENEFYYKSKNIGTMHACGHDVHMTWVLGAAIILSKYKDKLKGNIKFLFQPAEENPGGAKEMIEQGVLENPTVDFCFGAHVYPDLKIGKIGYREKEITSFPDFFKIKIVGKGGHGSMPHKANNPIPIGHNIYMSIEKDIHKKINPFEPLVISTCIFKSGTSRAIIPESVEIEGTVRSFNKDVRNIVRTEMENIVKTMSTLNDMKYEFSYSSACIPIFNDPELTKTIVNTLKNYNFEYMTEPFLGGEDFAFFSHKVPSTFFFIGSSNENPLTKNPLHHPKFNIDEDVIFEGINLYCDLALMILS